MNEWVVCPLLIPLNLLKTQYSGYITTGKRQYKFSISLKEAGKLSDARIQCEWELQQILKPHVDIIRQFSKWQISIWYLMTCHKGQNILTKMQHTQFENRLKECDSLSDFLKELQQIIDRCSAASPLIASGSSDVAFCGTVITDLQELGWQRLQEVDINFKHLKLRYTDACQRFHFLTVILNDRHPHVSPACYTDLPRKFNYSWTKESSLTDIYNEFMSAVNEYDDFWTTMAEIDKQTWILEPDNVTPSAVYRRIAIEKNLSLYINVDPTHPRQLPDIRFLGADKAIKEAQEKVNRNIHSWDTEESLLFNLQNLLDLTFPSPTETKKEDYSVECGICYSYRLNSETPDIMCDDERCAQPFHHSCLYEWLRGLTTIRQSFNVIFGECPYCSMPIKLKISKAR